MVPVSEHVSAPGPRPQPHAHSHLPAGEVKTLMIQLLRGVKHLHDNWILHRDLKTSNLLLSHAGILKVGPHCPAPGCPAPQLPTAGRPRPPCACPLRWETSGWRESTGPR